MSRSEEVLKLTSSLVIFKRVIYIDSKKKISGALVAGSKSLWSMAMHNAVTEF
jgi:hypothetical protein